jgi:hypothetical protein
MALLDGLPKGDSDARERALSAEMLDEERVARMQREWKVTRSPSA